jgi:hypothetical protein
MLKRVRDALVAACLGTAAGPAAAQDGARASDPAAAAQARPAVHVLRLGESDRVTIDGVLDEPVWARADPATNFRQRDPDNGAAATERTEVRIVFDQDRLVLGVTCFDSEPDKLLGNQMQRDQSFGADDRFMLSLDTYLNGRTGYFFEINPSGAMGDGLISGATGPGGGDDDLGGRMNKSWDGIWLARVKRSEVGWTAEVEIPFKTLNFDPNVDSWGANFQRTVRRKNEDSLWTGWLRNEGLTRMSNAGRVEGVREVSQGIGLDIKPYAVGSLSNAPGRAAPATIGDADIGVDFFYNVTPALEATFTVNTDFAETEVDERQVNLTRYPLFFPEKREFFLAGSNFFDFSLTPDTPPFFSRRIGLNDGLPQRILFGGKLLGQAGAFDVGLLHVRTGEEEDESLPSEDFSVVRLRRRFWSQSYAGVLYTRRATRSVPASFDVPLDDRHTAAADVSLATPNFRGRYNLEAGGWFSYTTPLASVDGGSNAYGWLVGFPNDPWSVDITFREVEGAYDAAVGFTPRRDFRRWNPDLQYSPRLSGHSYIRGFQFRFDTEIITDLDDQFITRNYSLTPLQIDFHSGDEVQVEVTRTSERLERDFEIEDGIVLPQGGRYDFTRYDLSLELSDRRPISAQLEYADGGFFSGVRRELGVSINVRPRPGINVGLEAEWNDVNLAEGAFTTSLYQLDARTQFGPWISLANNVQYDSDSREVGWQLRFRWILKPGDDIFFVYTQNWLEDLGQSRYRVLDRRAALKIVRTWRF